MWRQEAQKALDHLKHLLANAPVLVFPDEGEKLLLYVAATTQVVSAVLVVEREEEGHALKVQRPVYYVSEVLNGTKTRYHHLQKLVYAVVMTKRKLHHYFKSHEVVVVTSAPLGEIIQNREAANQIAKWALKLMDKNISYAPRNAIKS